MSAEKAANTHLSQKILFLNIINELPEKPSKLSLQDEQGSQDILGKLTLQREKALAESLAFLASTTDDPHKIVAACVEQKKGQDDSCTIRLAVNNGGLDHVKQGFQRISSILQKAASQISLPQKEYCEAVLKEAIILNRNRILTRMRSRHGKSKANFQKRKLNRPKIIPQLCNILEPIAKTRNSPLTLPFMDNVKQLADDFAQLESMTSGACNSNLGLQVILRLVKACKRISSQNLLDPILDTIKTIDKIGKIRISNKLTKLGLYVTATALLVDSAKKCAIFRNIEISAEKIAAAPVHELEPDVFTLNAINAYCKQPSNRPLLRKRGLSSTTDVKYFISYNVRRAPVVHAEMQLLFFYEWNRDLLAPRVICSNKLACFLCRLYFQLHGKFLVPSSHGRIYDNWALPSKASRQTVTAFSKCIESKINEAIGLPPAPYLYPAESAIFSACSKYSPSVITTREQTKMSDENSSKASHLDKGSKISHCSTDTFEFPVKAFQGQSEPISDCDEPRQVELTKGGTVTRKLGDVHGFWVVTSKIHLFFEFSKWVGSGTGNRPCLDSDFQGFWVDASWLSSQQTEENNVLFDLQNTPFHSEAIFELQDGPLPKSFYIKCYEEIISITINDI